MKLLEHYASWSDISNRNSDEFYRRASASYSLQHDYKPLEFRTSLDTFTETFGLVYSVETNNRRSYRGSICFITIDGVQIPAVTCFDSLSQVTLVSPTFVNSGWKQTTPPSYVIGAGNQLTKTKGEVLIPSFSFVLHGTIIPVEAAVVDMPTGVDIIIGLPQIHDFCIINEEYAFRMHVRKLKETIRMDHLDSILRRIKHPPLNILSLCGGIEPQVHVILSLGFRIAEYWSIESSETARAVARASLPSIKHIPPHDLNMIESAEMSEIKWDAVFGGFPCQGFSTRNSSPDGDLQLFRSGSMIINQATEMNPDIWKFIENVVPSSSLDCISEEQDRLLQLSSFQHNAFDSGSPASRPRCYWLDQSVSVKDFIPLHHINPTFLLDDDSRPDRIPYPCLMARMDTSSPPLVVSSSDSSRRMLSQNERDRVNPGLSAGISSGYGSLIITDYDRNLLNGNSFNADELWQVIRLWNTCRPHVSHSLSTSFDLSIAPPDSVELFFAQMTDSECWDYLQTKAMRDGLEMPLLDLILHSNQTIPFQSKAPGLPPARLGPSADYCADQLLRDGSHEEVSYSHDDWICLLFFKDKCREVIAEWDDPEGNYKKGDTLKALRPLKDQRVLNSATSIPPQWAEYSPDRDELTQFVPRDTAFFAPYDCFNAYHYVNLTTRSKRFCVSSYTNSSGRRRFLQARGGSQGLAAMGTFFPAWIRYGYCFFFSLHWVLWWIQFIDDGMAHAPDEQRCRSRYRMMTYAQLLMGLKPSPKHTFTISTSTDHVGMHWSGLGISLPDEAVKCLSQLLLQRPQNLKEARRLRGVILQSMSAFAFGLDDKMRFTTLMIPLNTLITDAENGTSKRIQWTDEHTSSMLNLSEHIQNSPRSYHDPNWVMSSERCIALVSDADPNAIAGYMVSVARSDARLITTSDLLDPNMTVLLSFYPKILNKSQRKWPIIEKEIFGHIHLLRKTHQFINSIIFKFARAEQVIPKLLYAGDNKSGMRKREAFQLPSADCPYLTAKFQRTTSWTEETAITTAWPSCSLDLPGDSNNLADMTCRFANLFKERLENPLPIPTFGEHHDLSSHETQIELAPPTVCFHSCFEQFPCVMKLEPSSSIGIGLCSSVPNGYSVHVIPMTADQWNTLPPLYLSDTDSYNGIFIRDIYSVAIGTYTGSKLIRSRVDAWINTLFFILPISTGHDTHVSILFTPSSCSRPSLSAEVDNSKRLVMVIPADMSILISNRSIDQQFYHDDQESWTNQNTTRADILWLSHDSHTPHLCLGTTMKTARQIAWWISLERDCKLHITWCSVCSSHRLRFKAIGLGQRCSYPLAVWHIDDKIITDPDILRCTGCVSILTMVEPTSGLSLFSPRRTKTAWEVGHIIYVKIVSLFGIPLQLVSDHAPEYIKEAALTICSIIGIPERITCALGSHSHFAESANRSVSQMLEHASAKGDLRSAIHLELYCASLQIKQNQIHETDGSTCFERLHGFTPNTIADLLTTPHLSESQLLSIVNNSHVNIENREFIESLHNRCEELISLRHSMSEKRSRYSMANRLSQQSNRCYSKEEFQVGHEVSYNGVKWIIERIKHSSPDSPITALISDSFSNFKWVNFDLLAPLSVPVPQNLLPVPTAYTIGTTVFYYDSDFQDRSRICCGDIMLTDPGTGISSVHVRQHNETASTWLPRWTNPLKPSRIYRHNYGKQGKNLVAFTDSISDSSIICSTTLTEGNHITDDTYYYLRSKGIDVQAPRQDQDVDDGI